jgi:hypothetical protein
MTKRLIEIAEKLDALIITYHPHDKSLHVNLGLYISAFCVPVFHHTNTNSYYILLVVFIAGLAKEFYDKYVRMSVFDVWDIAYTMIPAAILVACLKY